MPVRGLERVPAAEREWPVPWDALLELVDRGWLTLADLEGAVEPRWRTPTAADCPVDGVWFDVDRVERVLSALGHLRHTKGRWARTPLRLEAWQVAYLAAPVFGWVRVSDDDPDLVVRVVREAWIEIPRKNGKSTVASGFAVVLLVADGEPGAEVYAAATGRDQARIVFGESKSMAAAAPALSGKLKLLADLIRVPSTSSIFRVLSKLADAAHGLNVSGGIVDEVHVHRDRDLIDAIRTGTGARTQPLILLLTTSDDGSEGTIYSELHDDVVQLAEGTAEPDLATYGAIFAADEDADPFDVETWRQANPNMGVSVSERYLAEQAARARRIPSFLATFERLHLNLRRSTKERWIPLDVWDACGGLVDEEQLAGRVCFGGLDLGATDDFTAWVLVFPDRLRWLDGGDGGERVVEVDGFRVLPRIWMPAGAVERRPRMARLLERWRADGWLRVTAGDATDHAAIKAQVFADAERFELAEFAYDPWQSESLRQELMDGGINGWKCSQRLTHLAHPSRRLEELVASRGIDHGGHPVLRWMMGNTIPMRDQDGNVKPDKKRSGEKIDGVVALVMALAAATRQREAGQEGFALVVGGD